MTLSRHGVEPTDDPLLLQRQGLGEPAGHVFPVDVHVDEPGGVPNLVGEVPAGGHLLVGVAGVVAGGVAGDQGKAQGVGAVLVDHVHRVDAVAQGLAHLPALGIPEQAVVEHGGEGGLPRVLETREDHPGHPEEDDVVPGDQGVGGIEIVQLFRLVGPAQGWRRATERRRTRCPGCPHPGAGVCRRTWGRCRGRAPPRWSPRSPHSTRRECGGPTTAAGRCNQSLMFSIQL